MGAGSQRSLVLTAVGLLLALTGCGPGSTPGSQSASSATTAADTTAAFLASHWQRPLAPNGPAPARFSSLEATLAPEACGACHPQQYQDWRTALHSHAMSPGLLGQLQSMGADAREDHQACLQCHAPLAEQQEHLVRSLAAGRTLPPLAEGISSAQGLSCAGCHVRKNGRFGPRRLDGTVPASDSVLPHDGWQATDAFEDSRFCAACHQFENDGPSLNGKPLENTYAEWRASRYARENRSCQSCHMPQRKHLWRGIHDPAMVRSGVTVDAVLRSVADGRADAELTIANTGVGHAFPTYVTPRVVVEIGQEDRHGELIAATVERHVIGRDVSLDLTGERADTRLMPDETRRYAYKRPLDPRAAAVAYRITVLPDDFYAKFYRATLSDLEFKAGRPAIRVALRHAENSSYVLFLREAPVGLQQDNRAANAVAPRIQ